MSLIDLEQDDAAILKAEDEAIREAAQPNQQEEPDDIAELIERITAEVHQDSEG